MPDGTYMVDAVSNERRLKIRKDTTLKLSPGATIKAIPNGALNYSLLTDRQRGERHGLRRDARG